MLRHGQCDGADVDAAGPMSFFDPCVAIQQRQAIGGSQGMEAVLEDEEGSGPCSGVVLRREPGTPVTHAATVDEVTADLSKDPRREKD